MFVQYFISGFFLLKKEDWITAPRFWTTMRRRFWFFISIIFYSSFEIWRTFEWTRPWSIYLFKIFDIPDLHCGSIFECFAIWWIFFVRLLRELQFWDAAFFGLTRWCLPFLVWSWRMKWRESSAHPNCTVVELRT